MPGRTYSPIDVCSHKRSGTHYLMATLWYNFDIPDVTVSAILPKGKIYQDQRGKISRPGEVAHISWGGLWLTHGLIEEITDINRVICIVRDPVATLMSFWRFTDPAMTRAPYNIIGPDAVLRWYKQYHGYIKAGCMVVRYEDLIDEQHDIILGEIELKFGFQRTHREFKRFYRRVGWYSEKKPRQGDVPPPLLTDAVEKIVPSGFLGYN